MLIYDIEILKAVPDRQGQREPDIEYCGGWQDHKGMGIAVLGCYDYVRDCYRVFCQDNLSEFTALIGKHDVLIGFNNLCFDNRILTAQDIPVNDSACYDLFIEIQRGLGLDFNDPGQRRSGYNLQSVAYANFRLNKSGAGANAPALWQRGKIGSVIDYCLFDVYLTKRLIDRVIRSGALVDPLDATSIPIRKPGVHQ
jgi:DEAD/DEAH box helicase domain-containing protein